MNQQLLPDGWYPDPTGRHEERYVHEGQWSAEVRNQGVQATEAAGVQNPAQPEPRAIAKKGRGWIWVLVLLAVLMLVGWLADGEPSEEERGLQAVLACQDFVEPRLKAPGSADFPNHDEAQTSHVGDRWRVESYVDSENSFGAKLRTHYTCVVTYNPATDGWKLSGLQLK